MAGRQGEHLKGKKLQGAGRVAGTPNKSTQALQKVLHVGMGTIQKR